MTPTDDTWLTTAVDLAVANVGAGGGPFGALVVLDDAVVGTGTNRVVPDLDPTAHAEVVAIRAACRALGTHVLQGATVVASCEPCPMCLAASLWARVDRVLYAADRHDAARAGFDDARFHRVLGTTPDPAELPVVQHRVPGATRPMDAWLAHAARVAY